MARRGGVTRSIWMWAVVTTLAAAAVSAALLTGGIDRAGGAFPGRDGRIAFDRLLKNKKGGFTSAIVTVKPNGKDVNVITPRCCKDAQYPTWSANGRRIAFTRDDRVFTMNKKGKDRERLTGGRRFGGKRFNDTNPSWSPDRSRIAFTREYENARSDLFVVDSDGSNLREVPTGDLDELQPAWSPDGQRIGFTARGLEARPSGIYRMRPDGSDVQLVIDVFALSPVGQAPGGQFQAGLDWSPDDQLLAFSFQPEEAGSPQIYTVHADGSQQTQLTTAGTTEAGRNTFDPAFSPQGNRIVFTVEGVLHTMGSEGGDVKRLLKKSRGVGDFDPSWQPR